MHDDVIIVPPYLQSFDFTAPRDIGSSAAALLLLCACAPCVCQEITVSRSEYTIA